MSRVSRRRRQKGGWLHMKEVIAELKSKYHKRHHKRITLGVEWVAAFWHKDDGTAAEFAKFCEEFFVADSVELDLLRTKVDGAMEQIFGMALELYRKMHRPLHLDIGPISRWDRLLVRIDPFTALNSCLFDSKIAFVVLLNFVVYSTDELLALEDRLPKQDWLDCRLTDWVRHRMKQALERRVHDAYCDAEEYVDNYNIYSTSLVGPDGRPVFSEPKKLLSHWGLRDELRAQYFQSGGQTRQETLYAAMKRIILQQVPAAIIDTPGVFWDPFRNKVFNLEEGTENVATGEWVECGELEPNVRYGHLRKVFLAEKATDSFYQRDFIERSMMDACEIPQDVMKDFLVQILSSPLAKATAKAIRRQIGRRLRPFDIWFNRFVRHDERRLDPIVKAKYPDPQSFELDIPNILMKLGFDPKIARLIGDNIHVDACRGSGHAWGTLRREDKVLLRTRFQKDGLDWQGFDIGMHELGHCAEMVLCLHLAENFVFHGLPGVGFSEAFAFFFEMHKLEALGQTQAKKDEYRLIVNGFWDAFEIAGVALLDLCIWKWMYDHKKAKPEDINRAIRGLAKTIWNEYFAPVLGVKDEYILAIYSHIISNALYMPNYAIGQIVTFQVLDYCQNEHWPTEMERMCKIGTFTPNAWLKQAVGSPLSLEPMFRLTEKALKKLK